MEMFHLSEGEKDVFDHINNCYFHMTKTEKRVADYVMAHRAEPKYMSISELASECSVAEATISRFCRTLGFRGYNAFKLELAKASAAPNGTALNLEELTMQVLPEDSVSTMCQKLLAINSEALKQTFSFVEQSKIDRAVELLMAAENVYCMGQGGSLVLAQEAYSLFLTVSPKFHAVADSHLQILTVSLMTPRDVVLFFSYSGATKDLMEFEQVAASSGAKIILVSRFPKSPGAEHAEVVLKCGSNESPLRSGSVAARMAQLFIIDILFTEMERRSTDSFSRNRERTANALTGKLM